MHKYKNKPKRIYLENHYYFVTVKTYNNKYIFKNPKYCEIFIQTMEYLKNREDFELSAGVLLPNHFHLLLKPVKKNISEIMHDLKSYTTTKISRQIFTRRGVEASALGGTINQTNNTKRQGFHALPHCRNRKTISVKIWQQSFYYHIIDHENENDFTNHYNYIYHNPVRHGYIKDSKDWPYLIIGEKYTI